MSDNYVAYKRLEEIQIGQLGFELGSELGFV